VGFASELPLFVPAKNEDGAAVWETAHNKRKFFNVQRFSGTKPAATRRLFCLGGSTTYGRPYFDGTSFCGWLRELLPAADRRTAWEVINAGGISYASYRVANVAKELTRHEPDVLVVYTGHNEFLEERTYSDLRDRNAVIRGVEAMLRRTRTDALIRSLVIPAQGGSSDLLHGEVSTPLDRSIGPGAYEREDPSDVDARYNLARGFRLRGDWRQAATEYEQVLALAPDDSDARAELREVRSLMASELGETREGTRDSGVGAASPGASL